MLNIQPMQGEDMMKEYLKSADEVFANIGSSANGLTSAEAQTRLEKNGKNKLAEAKKPSVIKKFFAELADPMIIILLIAAAVSGVTAALQSESFTDVFIILAVVLINAVLGVVQESKAEKAIEALQKITAATSKVLRDGRPVTVKSEDLVVGDVVLLEAGDAVPADCRLIEAASLKAEESALTGESVPVTKCAEKLCADGKKDVPLGDRKNMVYMGSSVSYGRGVAVVTAVGMDTEMGKIAGALAAAKDEDTPLQKKLNQLSKILSVLVLGVCVVVFAVDILRIVPNVTFDALLKTFMVAVSLAVAAVPEGLAAVVTIVLSMGVTKMSKRNAVIRKLTAVETLGCTQIICSDKTGTLTQNKMTVVERSSDDEKLLATAMAVCSDAKEGENGEAVGEPTECALVNDAISLGLADSINGYKRIGEAPFDSMRKMMSVVVENGGHIVQFTKGAPDEVLKHCTHYLENGEELPMTEKVREKILAENKRMADKALRVLCAAKKEHKEKPANTEPAELENDLCYIGLSGMIDPIRPEVKAAIAECREAGIRPVMITGDHKDTAVAIAKELGIITDASQAITGAELDDISDEDFAERVKDYSVYARVQPEHKVRIVKAWRALGKVTAMTGDGVNDAPVNKERRHRRGHGNNGHGCDEKRCRYGIGGRQFRNNRLRSRRGTQDIRQYPKSHTVPACFQLGGSSFRLCGIVARVHYSQSRPPALDKPYNGLLPGPCARNGARRSGRNETSAERFQRRHILKRCRRGRCNSRLFYRASDVCILLCRALYGSGKMGNNRKSRRHDHGIFDAFARRTFPRVQYAFPRALRVHDKEAERLALGFATARICSDFRRHIRSRVCNGVRL